MLPKAGTVPLFFYPPALGPPLIGEKTQLAAIRGFLPLYVSPALFLCYFKTAVCGAARRARADFFGFWCQRLAQTSSAAARPRADAAMMAHSGQLFLGTKTAFLSGRLEHPNLGRCAMPRHQLPAPRRGRLPRPPWRPARGRLFYRDRRITGRNSKNGEKFITITPIPRVARRHDVHIGLATALLGNVHHILR